MSPKISNSTPDGSGATGSRNWDTVNRSQIFPQVPASRICFLLLKNSGFSAGLPLPVVFWLYRFPVNALFLLRSEKGKSSEKQAGEPTPGKSPSFLLQTAGRRFRLFNFSVYAACPSLAGCAVAAFAAF